MASTLRFLILINSSLFSRRVGSWKSQHLSNSLANLLADWGLNQHVAEYMSAVNEALVQNNEGVLSKTETMTKRIRKEIKQLRNKHLEDLSGGNIAPVICVAYLAMLNAYSRVRDHAQNIAEVVSGEK